MPTTTLSTPPKNKSVKVFGFWTAVSLVLGNMIGSGIFFLPTSLAHFGPIGILGWAVTAIGAISLAYIFAILSIHNPCSGGPFTHAKEAFGDGVGFAMAWGYWIMIWSSNAAISLAFVSYFSHFYPFLAADGIHTFISATLLTWITTGINCANLRYGGMVQVFTVIVKLIPLVLVCLTGLFYIDPQNYIPINPSGDSTLNAISGAAALTMWAFIGLESATVPGDNVKNPKKTISSATLLGTAITAGIYILITIIVFGIIPADKLSTTHAPFVEVATHIFGNWIGPFIGFCVLTSIFGGLNGWTLLQGQIPYALAKQGLFPKVFAKTSKSDTPVFGVLFSNILTTLLLIMNTEESLVHQFNHIILIGSIMTMLAYLATNIAALKLFKGWNKKISFSLLLAVLLGSGYVLWAIAAVGVKDLLICLIAYGIGIPIYWFSRRQHSRCQSL